LIAIFFAEPSILKDVHIKSFVALLVGTSSLSCSAATLATALACTLADHAGYHAGRGAGLSALVAMIVSQSLINRNGLF